MENDFARIRDAIRFVDQVKQYTPDEETFGRLRADLFDLFEMSEWLLKTLPEMGDKKLTNDEIETFLIELDVRFAEHAQFHAKSLHQGIAVILKELSRRNSD